MNKQIKQDAAPSSVISAAPTANTAAVAQATIKPETAEQYEKRIAKMSDKQLVSEIRKQKKTLTNRHIQYKLCDILLVMMDSKKNGLTPYLRG